MNRACPINLIIAGIGGQGVYTLTQVFQKLCNQNDLKCQCSVFKGGAQKHGSIYSEMRIFIDSCAGYSMYSTQIPKDELDLIIGFEPFETYRFIEYMRPQTKIILNTVHVPFPSEILPSVKIQELLGSMAKETSEIVKRDFTKDSIKQFGDERMLNFLLGLEVIKLDYLPINQSQYISCFIHQTEPDEVRKSAMRSFLKREE